MVFFFSLFLFLGVCDAIFFFPVEIPFSNLLCYAVF